MSDAVRRDMGERDDYEAEAEARAIREEIRNSLKSDRDFNDLPWDEKDKVVKNMARMELERRAKAAKKAVPAPAAAAPAEVSESTAPGQTEGWFEYGNLPYSVDAHKNLNLAVAPVLARMLRERPENAAGLRAKYTNVLLRMYQNSHPGSMVGDDLTGWFEQAWSELTRQAESLK